jgi:hypothetical protein
MATATAAKYPTRNSVPLILTSFQNPGVPISVEAALRTSVGELKKTGEAIPRLATDCQMARKATRLAHGSQTCSWSPSHLRTERIILV